MARQSETLPEYEGWRNKPTWAVSLWITNDEGMYEMARDTVRLASEPVEALREYVEQLCGEWLVGEDGRPGADSWPASITSDLLQWALAYVDWDEIVEGLREE